MPETPSDTNDTTPDISPDEVNLDNVEDFSPYKLLTSFSRNRILPCVILALVFHVAVIGGTSVNFIYFTWISPNEAEETGDTENGEKSSETPSAEKSPESPDGATAEKPAGEKTGAEKGGDAETPKKPGKGGEAPVIKKITETPKEGETPTEPDGLGISLEDTNR